MRATFVTADDMKWSIIFLIALQRANGFRCDRRPYGATTQSSPADGRFKLQVVGDHNMYIPDQLYTVQIAVTDEQSRFTAFMISAEGDLKSDPRNPRRMFTQYPGEVRPHSLTVAKFSDRCLYSVEQATISLKSSVEIYWQAPPSGSGCVTLRAMVVENENTWFEDGGPLTAKICEDMRQPDDVSPQLNYECQICEDAKYEVSYTGIWSRNTHPRNFPENDWLPRYSDLVGASHTSKFVLWAPGIQPTNGLTQLAEHANSSLLEKEILEKVGDGVHTLIKGRGHKNFKMVLPTYAFFRANKDHHLVSVAIAISPSPDWFLGVARFELCQTDNTWLTERELNLYPWDAGTDSGVSYESPNIVTFPMDAVSRVQMSSYDANSPFYEMDIKDLHPFGRLQLKLVRTYPRKCEETTETETEETEETEDSETGEESNEEQSEPEEPSRYQYPDLSSDDGGSPEPEEEEEKEDVEDKLQTEEPKLDDCPLSSWDEWSSCDGDCEDGVVKGLRWAERYHLVDGIAIEKYDPKIKHKPNKEVPAHCKNKYETVRYEECEAECNENDADDKLTAQQRVAPIIPGHPWSKKRTTKIRMPNLNIAHQN